MNKIDELFAEFEVSSEEEAAHVPDPRFADFQAKAQAHYDLPVEEQNALAVYIAVLEAVEALPGYRNSGEAEEIAQAAYKTALFRERNPFVRAH